MARTSRKKEKTAAVLTIFGAPRMHKRGKDEIAEWLIAQAANLIHDGDKYSPTRFTARYLYR